MSTANNPICLIEDNKAIRKMFGILLNKAGYQIQEFEDGKTAVDWLNTNSALCIIVDILLPDMNGTEILSVIRNQPDGGRVPVIAVTGFAHPSDREKYLAIGFDDYISKPVDTTTFANLVKQIIENKKQKM
ncbi:MAG: response regulator [Bacteroidetes bacterium]|nr:MAG: response regulator [Bacteroidota bacterium]